MAASSTATFTVESCIRGYHVYKSIWDATVGEELECARESANPADRYAVAMKKNGETVGHVPKKMSRLCALFLERNGTILCTVTGPRRHSADLPQGGLELPCTLTFSGDSSAVSKVQMILASTRMKPQPKQATARLFPDSMAYLATWAFCSGENFMYGPREGPEPCFELHSDARRADTFRLALSIACGFTVLDKGPLGSGRDLDLT